MSKIILIRNHADDHPFELNPGKVSGTADSMYCGKPVQPKLVSMEAADRSLLTCLIRQRRLIVGVVGAIASLLISSSSFASCPKYSVNMTKMDIDSITTTWERRVSNSDNLGLRTAYSEGECKYLKGVHSGDDPTIRPANVVGSTHVTVAYKKFTCHVYESSTTPPAALAPTSCVKQQAN